MLIGTGFGAALLLIVAIAIASRLKRRLGAHRRARSSAPGSRPARSWCWRCASRARTPACAARACSARNLLAVVGDLLDRVRQHLRVLRAGNRRDAADDEGRHAVDAGVLGGIGRCSRRVRRRRRSPACSRIVVGVHADVGGGLDQHLAVGEVGALGEIEVHQPLLHLRRLADRLRPQDQAVAVERVGLPLHLVDRVGQALGGGGGGDAPGDLLVALGRAELGGEVLVAADALARHPGIEEIGVVAHLDRNIRLQRQGLLKPALSDEAPGADHVGDDVDRDGRDGLVVGHGGPRWLARYS